MYNGDQIAPDEQSEISVFCAFEFNSEAVTRGFPL